jgi:hypothetical protein
MLVQNIIYVSQKSLFQFFALSGSCILPDLGYFPFGTCSRLFRRARNGPYFSYVAPGFNLMEKAGV